MTHAWLDDWLLFAPAFTNFVKEGLSNTSVILNMSTLCTILAKYHKTIPDDVLKDIFMEGFKFCVPSGDTSSGSSTARSASRRTPRRWRPSSPRASST